MTFVTESLMNPIGASPQRAQAKRKGGGGILRSSDSRRIGRAPQRPGT